MSKFTQYNEINKMEFTPVGWNLRREKRRAQALPAVAFFGRRNEVKVAAKAGPRAQSAERRAQSFWF